MGLKELIEGIYFSLTRVQVMSYRYLWEMRPYLEKNDWGDDDSCFDNGNNGSCFNSGNPFHFIPENLKNSMSPLTRTAYETVKESMGAFLYLGYSCGRFVRETAKDKNAEFDPTSFDRRIEDSFCLSHMGHAATELYFFRFAKMSSILDKTVGYSIGIALSPIAFIAGFAVPPED